MNTRLLNSASDRRAAVVRAALMVLCVGSVMVTGVTAGSRVATADQTPELEESWLDRVTGHLEALEYEPSIAAGTLQAPNRAQGFRSYFESGAVVVGPRTLGSNADAATTDTPWQWRWETVTWGREQSRLPLAPVDARVAGTRVEYEYPGLVEWYVNGTRGVEQGFTIVAPPAAGTRDDDRFTQDLLCIEGRVSGAANVLLAADGQSASFFDSDGAHLLRYDHLEVYDAHGRRLPAHLERAASGISILVDDTDAIYPIVVDPLLSNPSWAYQSNQSDAELGHSVATAGDVNGDGYSDVIVGVPGYDFGHDNEGAAFVFHGSAAGLSATPVWRAESDEPGAALGYSVSTAGDVNGDGFDDVVIGAYFYDGTQALGGAVFVWHGSTDGLGPNGTPANSDWRAVGTQASGWLGSSVATAGDLNHDGYADILAGATGYDDGQQNEGVAFAWYGSATGLGGDGTELGADWNAQANDPFGHFATSVASAGDVNADGYDDVIIGCPQCTDGQTTEGEVFVWLGGNAGLGNNGNPGNVDWHAQVNQDGAGLGHSVATAGDVNADGYADVIIGAPNHDESGLNDNGKLFVWFGSEDGPNNGFDGNAFNFDWRARGSSAGAQLGWSVGTVGDANGDGHADVIAGAPHHDGQGGAWVWYGDPGGLPGSSGGTEQNAAWSGASGQASSEYGASVAAAGDVNGDGYSDIIVGTPEFDGGQSHEGHAAVYHGGPYGLDTYPVWWEGAFQAGAVFGTSAAFAGDVNGDGFDDIIVGAPGYDNGQAAEGRVFVYHGSREDLPPIDPDWTAEIDLTGANLGSAVGTAGDVNGDGYSDIIAGASSYSNGQEQEGGLFVWLGGAGGLGANGTLGNVDWRAESDQEFAWLGGTAGTAGDLNGDGRCEVWGGSLYWTDTASQEGGVWVWYGGENGLGANGTPANADWYVEGEASSAGLDAAGAAGDVNGDGFGDLVIGNGWVGDGSAHVWYGSESGLGTGESVANADWTVTGPADPFGSFGNEVDGAGDVNGDGFSDIIVAAPFHTTLSDREGAAYVYHGSPAGPSMTPDWTGTDTLLRGRYAASISPAGDVNGDGFSDVLVGQYRFVPGMIGPGRAFCYLGSASGLETTADWMVENEPGDDSDHFAEVVAGAGDVNGDGFSDVMVTAIGAGTGGLIYVYYGNDGGWFNPSRNVQQIRADGTAPIDLLGASDAFDAFNVRMNARSALGRADVTLEWEVKRIGESFDGTELQQGVLTLTGIPDEELGSLHSSLARSGVEPAPTTRLAHFQSLSCAARWSRSW
jgi:uncharacterized protein YciU (UPF0263 family)